LIKEASKSTSPQYNTKQQKAEIKVIAVEKKPF
jgi:hypothetical protein